MSLLPQLTDLEYLARKAGTILEEYRDKHFTVMKKGRINLVTEADQASERFILDEIKKNFPDHRIIAEESGIHRAESKYCWYIDPLDGTGNYAHGLPIYSVSIGFAVDGQLQLGVVYDPTRDECFSASAGKGAWLNGKSIRVAEASSLEQAMLVTGFPYDIATTSRDNLQNYAAFARLSRGVRRLGSAALDLAYIASGRLDGYWELDLQPYDVAAGALLVIEAGGLVTTTEGGLPFMVDDHASVLAANPSLHRHILKVLQQNQK